MRLLAPFLALVLLAPLPLGSAGVTARVEPDIAGPAVVLVDAPTTFTGYVYAYGEVNGAWARNRAPVAGIPVEIVNETGKVVARTSTSVLGSYSVQLTFPTRGDHTLTAIAHRGTMTEGRSVALAVRAGATPSLPTLFTAVEATPNRMEIAWGLPEDDGGMGPVTFRLYRGYNGQPLAPLVNLNPATVGYNYSFNIPANTDVTLELRAVNSLGEGPGSSHTFLRKVYPVVEVEITHFHVCRDGGDCVDVPAGATLGVWTGRYRYSAHFDGSATRDGTAWGNFAWRTEVLDDFQGDTYTIVRTGKTLADGSFAGQVGTYILDFQSGCNMGAYYWHSFDATATVDGTTATDSTFLVFNVASSPC